MPTVPLLWEAIAPTLVQQTIDDQLTLHLAEFATDFSSLGSVRSTLFELIFCELSMTKISSRDPCTPFLGSWSATRPTMEPASPLLFICRALTWGPIAGFCSAPLTGPISTKAPFYANRNVGLISIKAPRIQGIIIPQNTCVCLSALTNLISRNAMA